MYKFGKHAIRQGSVFWESALSYGFVNIKPVLPGHVLISPRRVEPSFTELTEEETTDLFRGSLLCRHSTSPDFSPFVGFVTPSLPRCEAAKLDAETALLHHLPDPRHTRRRRRGTDCTPRARAPVTPATGGLRQQRRHLHGDREGR